MSEIDLYLQQFFLGYILFALYAWFILYAIGKMYPKVKNFIVLQQMYESERCYAEVTRFQRQELLVALHGLFSADFKLRNEGVIRIVDIGVMTGINLKYYPNSSHVIAVDTRDNLKTFFMPHGHMFDHVQIKQCIEFDFNTLRNIPDNFADAVVSSFILCKTKNEAILLGEIKRILAPGGHYYFIEHCHENEDSRLKVWQTILTWCGIWPYLFQGCCLNRDPEQAILKSSLSVVKCNRKKMFFLHPFALKFIRSHIFGHAVKH